MDAAAGARRGGARPRDPPLLRDQGGDRRARRARAGRPRAAQPRPHLRACDRVGHRLQRVAAWRGGRRGAADGGRHVARMRAARCRGERGAPAASCSSAPACRRERRTCTPTPALEHMRIDKKVKAGRSAWCCCAAIGERVRDRRLSGAALRRTLEAHFGERVSDSRSSLAATIARALRGPRRAVARPPPSGAASRSIRSEFQRDRDRIIHSNAFRRLVYKTQVFVNHEGDLYRTRVTHSIEVAQIARSVARALRLNEALTEAICLAHDLGHTPFGHAGQDALNAACGPTAASSTTCSRCAWSIELEERYAEFRGLNLTFECREGILKHCSRAQRARARRARRAVHPPPPAEARGADRQSGRRDRLQQSRRR